MRRCALVLAAAGTLLVTVGVAPSIAHVTAVRGSAYGYFASMSLFGGPNETRGPAPKVDLAPDASNSPQTATASSANVQFGPARLFTSDQIDVSTSGSLGPTGSVTSSTDIDNVNKSGAEILTATNIAGTCTATESGTSGSTTINNGTLQTDDGLDNDNDGDFTDPGEHPPVVVNLSANPAPNTTYDGHLHSTGDSYQVIVNEQVVNSDGSLTLNAVHERFLGPTAVGDLLVGHVECGVTATPGFTLSDVSLEEGNSGTKTFTFTVTRSGSAAGTAAVHYATADGTATAGSDYVGTSGDLTFATGVTSQTIAVTVNGDVTNESDETFTVNLSSPSGAVISDGQGVGTIRNDDAPAPPPTLAIDDVFLDEGKSGSTTFLFTVTRSGDTSGASTVSYATSDGTATAGSDYVSAIGSLSFAVGVTTQTIAVTVNGDADAEGDETFTVNLSSPSGATISDPVGQATIRNDDAGTQAADLSITATGRAAANVGGRVRYTLTAMNVGTGSAGDVVLIDRLPPSSLLVRATAAETEDSCSLAGRVVTCRLGALTSGSTDSVLVLMMPFAAGSLVNRAEVSSASIDADDTNNSASVTSAVVLPDCTQTASSRGGTLIGTARRDVLCGRGGNETLRGRGGNDVLIGGRGNDFEAGGIGFDVVMGQAGADVLQTIDAVEANDAALGGPGADTCRTDAGDKRRSCP